MISLVRGAVLDAWAVLMPVDCAGCGAPDRGLCAACLRQLAPATEWHRLPDGTPVVSALDYSGVARRTILSFKEQGRTDAARALAAPLYSAVAAACTAVACTVAAGAITGNDTAGSHPTRPLELLTVPPGKSSYRRRGYDPVSLLLRRAGFAKPAAVLRHARGTEQQKALDRESRSRNLVGSLQAKHPLDGRTFILVDDVMTTGATLLEGVRAVREAGGDVAVAATLAHTEKLFSTHETS